MKEATLTVQNKVGLHARPAAVFFKKARQFKSTITIQNLSRAGSPEVTVSAFNLLQIGVKQGNKIRLRTQGDDEEEALMALTQLIREKFGEEE
jgi:phosphocarrier protein HPr